MQKKVRQIIIKYKDNSLLMVARYDISRHLLYKQNRSYDERLNPNDFADRLTSTKEQAKKQGFIVEDTHVSSNALWPQVRG
jgi:hypothetical protein